MTSAELQNLLDVAAGRKAADLLIKNCQLISHGDGRIALGEIAIAGPYIAGITFYEDLKSGAADGVYKSENTLDAQGAYCSPGLMDAHIHIESSYLTPEELGRLLVPLGTSTIIADPHEIVNVAGIEGFRYMQAAAEKTRLKIEYLVPSCVPATAFETAGADLEADDLRPLLEEKNILGLAELMNYPGVVHADPAVLAKIMAAKDLGKLIDGHAPALQGQGLNAYAAAGILADHECSTAEEARDRLARGLYVMLRQGSSCHNLAQLLSAVNKDNYTRCLLCSDDRHADTILKLGHLNEHLKICVQNGLSPLQALRMATLNTAEAFGLKDRGALFPGRKADLTLFKDLENFEAKAVYIDGELVAEDGQYLPTFERADSSTVRRSFHLGHFSADKLRLHSKSSQVRTMLVQPGGVLTKAGTCQVELDEDGRVLLPADRDLVYLAVVERHRNTGNIGLGLLEGYGLKSGAIASSIAHDSHNILVAGREQAEMAKAVEALVEQEGGIVLVQKGEVIAKLPLPVGGLMSEESATDLAQSLSKLEELAHSALGISREIDPMMTLSFMSLAVIPVLKLTDLGLFDVSQFKLVDLEV